MPLVELGHDVIRFRYELTPHFRNLDPSDPLQRAFIEENRPKLEEALLEQVERAHRHKRIDLFFSYFYSACATPATIAEIRRLGIITVNFFCNAVHQFRLVEELAPAYDHCMVPERVALERYRGAGASPIHIQMGANPEVYRPYALPTEYDVTFVGQMYGDRSSYISFLHHNGINIRAWGDGWEVIRVPSAVPTPPGRWTSKMRKLLSRDGPVAIRDRAAQWSTIRRYTRDLKSGIAVEIPRKVAGPPLSDDQLIKIYSQSRISLGFSGTSENGRENRRLTHLRLRDFEAPMSGAFYMVEYMDELEDYYDIGEEIVCYENKEDMLEKARHFLAHPEIAQRIRAAGYARARQDHTWTNRFNQLFDTIGLK